MPTDLGPQFTTSYTGIPPHMSAGDYNIWQRYHALYWQQFQGFYYDVAVGKGAIVPPDTPENMARAWTRLTQKRIDVIGIRNTAIWIIEVRDSAGSSALGAILTYLHLLRDDNPFSLPLAGAILTDHADPDFKSVIADYGIQLIEI